MTPETVLAKIQKLVLASQNQAYGKKDYVGIDSLALSLQVKVQDLMMHLTILEQEGEIVIQRPKLHPQTRLTIGHGFVKLP